MERTSSDETPEPLDDECQRAVERWYQEHPDATFVEMEEAVEEQLNRLRRRLLEKFPPKSQARAVQRRCSGCGGRCVVRGEHERTVLLPGGEFLRPKRPYMVCQRCGVGRFPLDDALGLFPGGLSPRLHEAVVRLSTSLPFAQAAREVRWLLGVNVSEQLACRLTERVGATSVALHDSEVERFTQERPAPPPGPAVQQISADGAMVPLVHGEWAEVKTVAIGTVVATPSQTGTVPRATDISYFSRLADHETFSRAAWPELHRRGTETAGVVVAVADGSEWLQKFIDLQRPNAVRILDFPHAVEHLALAAQATYGVGTAATTTWLAEQTATLRHGDPATVLAALKHLPTSEAKDPMTATTVRESTLTYFTKRQSQITFATFLAKGYPIGSGMVESANKLVVEARLKGSGMHWARPNVNPLLSLRTSLCSDRWDATWQPLAKAQRQAARGRTQLRRAARLAARPSVDTPPTPVSPAPATNEPARTATPPKPPTMVNGRPTADHPWRKFSLRRQPPDFYAKNEGHPFIAGWLTSAC